MNTASTVVFWVTTVIGSEVALDQTVDAERRQPLDVRRNGRPAELADQLDTSLGVPRVPRKRIEPVELAPIDHRRAGGVQR